MKKVIAFIVLAILCALILVICIISQATGFQDIDVSSYIISGIGLVVFVALAIAYTLKNRKTEREYRQEEKAKVTPWSDHTWAKDFMPSDEERTVDEMKAKAEAGDVTAQTVYGFWLCVGIPEKGINKDTVKGISFIKNAAETNLPLAQCYLGICYEEGLGIPKDEYKAFSLYQKSAAQNFPLAIAGLGTCYMQGIGVVKDYNKSIYWYKKAIDSGFLNAMGNLGLVYLYNGDKENAKKYLQIAAQRGEDCAKINLEKEFGIKI